MRWAQVKMIADDVESLARWYVDNLGCELTLGPLDLDDPGLCRSIGAPTGTILRLAILRAPGQPEEGAIIEFYSMSPHPGDWPSETGQGQLAFEVGDVDSVVAGLLESGASLHGEVSEWVAPSGRTSRFVYLRDPEGNIVDIFTRSGEAS